MPAAPSVEENLVAELGVVLLGDRLEIGSNACHHAAYLAHWIELLGQSPRLLFELLGEARPAAELIAPDVPQDPGAAHGAGAFPSELGIGRSTITPITSSTLLA